jgi:low temperature requirement protein LtrA
MKPLTHMLRSRDTHARVTNVELFFDLVFVFAVTQLSHTLLEHRTLAGALEVTFLLLSVWWVWMYTCWFTNYIDPDKPAVRMVMFVLMLAGLALSASIPHAFGHDGHDGLVFASAYAFMQVVRTAFLVRALHGHDVRHFQNMRRVLVWLAASAPFWIAGGFAHDGLRAALWIVALGIEYCGPLAFFYVPGLGRSTTADWKVDASHMAERCSLFVIIALGESILVTGATSAELPATAGNMAAFITAFAGSVAMWWIYFNIGAERGSRQFASSEDRGRVARNVYTYFHMPIVAGIVVCAVADEIAIAHPLGHVTVADAAVMLAGPALYLFGNVFFKRASAQYYPLSHLVGLGILAVTAPFAVLLTPLALGAITTTALVVVAVWETRSFSNPARTPA